MWRTVSVLILSLLLARISAAEQATESKAFLRSNSSGAYYVALVLNPPPAPNTPPEKVVASLYRAGRLITQTVGGGDAHGAHFTLPLGPASAFGGDGRGLLAAVSSYPTGDASQPGAFAGSVVLEVQTSVITNNVHCDLGIHTSSDRDREPTTYEAARIQLLHDYIRAHAPKVETELRSERGVRTPAFQFANAVALSNFITDCFGIRPGLGPGVYDVKLTFPDDAPIELRPALLKTGLTIASHKSAPFSVDAGQVGKRTLEENLDLGLQFGSSVTKDANGVSTRSNKGSVDLRFAPLLNLLPLPDTESNSFWFLTPVMLDARVSSGDVTKETISQNRIVIGSDVEWRHYTSPTTFPTYQRLIMSVRNASDREFKQAEWKAGGELHLISRH